MHEDKYSPDDLSLKTSSSRLVGATRSELMRSSILCEVSGPLPRSLRSSFLSDFGDDLEAKGSKSSSSADGFAG